MPARNPRFPYLFDERARFSIPILPMKLKSNWGKEWYGHGLVDTGSPCNVLPRSVGEQLGFSWNATKDSGTIGGGLLNVKVKAIEIQADFPSFDTVAMAFLWTENENARPILGHLNFFTRFNVCFFASELAFEVRPVRKARKQS